LGAIVSDQYLGKYRTIVLFAGFYLAGLATLFITSLPYSIEHGTAFFGLVVSMFLIGLGTGGIKSNVSPLIAEQITEDRPKIRLLKTGERVIVDPGLTVERVFFVFYACINIGSLGSIATTNLELHLGFWSAYLLALCMFVLCFVVLVGGRKHYVVRPPQGSVIVDSLRVIYLAVKGRTGLDGAKPSIRRKLGLHANVPWNDQFVDELKKALAACKVFLFFPVYWMVFNQVRRINRRMD
jgi:POT family proton-dependent oligopeptide transporter